MTLDIILLILSITFSLFYGISSYRIFTYPHTDEVYTKNNLEKFDITKRARVHEGWAHFFCSMLGWFCLYIIYLDLFRTGIYNINLEEITFNYYLLLLIGILGVIGFLPRALWNITETILELTKRLTKS